MDLELLIRQCNLAKELIDMKSIESLTEAQISIVDAKMNLRSLQRVEYGPDNVPIVPIDQKMDMVLDSFKSQNYEGALGHLVDLTIYAMSKVPAVTHIKDFRK